MRSTSDVIQRVTAWGLTDRGSWKNNFPVPGRKDYPLLIDRDGQPKPFVLELIDEAQKNQNFDELKEIFANCKNDWMKN